jgi:hypothetical protein
MMDILQLIFGKLKAIHTAITGGVRTTDSRMFSGPKRVTISNGTSANVQFTTGKTRARLTAKGVTIRFNIGTTSAVSASPTLDHLLLIGTSTEITFASGAWIAGVADASTGTGTLEISEIE